MMVEKVNSFYRIIFIKKQCFYINYSMILKVIYVPVNLIYDLLLNNNTIFNLRAIFFYRNKIPINVY